jgi:hypothetical protein
MTADTDDFGVGRCSGQGQPSGTRRYSVLHPDRDRPSLIPFAIAAVPSSTAVYRPWISMTRLEAEVLIHALGICEGEGIGPTKKQETSILRKIVRAWPGLRTHIYWRDDLCQST